jgi:hypothetical protein
MLDFQFYDTYYAIAIEDLVLFCVVISALVCSMTYSGRNKSKNF